MDIRELIEERGILDQEVNDIFDSVKDGERLTDDQLKEIEDKQAEMKKFDKEIVVKQAQEQRAALKVAAKVADGKVVDSEGKEMEKFSVNKALMTLSKNKPLEGFEAEINQEGEKDFRESKAPFVGTGISLPMKMATLPSKEKLAREKRDLTVSTEGADLVETTHGSFIDVLRATPQLVNLGATLMTGLVGDLLMPRQSAAGTFAWEGENDAAAETTQTFDNVTCSPKRVGGFTDLSIQLLKQSSQDMQAIVNRDLAGGLVIEIDEKGINGSGAGGEPTGILNVSGIGDVAGGANGGNPDWADIIGLETEVSQDNAFGSQNFYLSNSKAIGKLKNTAKDAGSGLFVINDVPTDMGFAGTSNGYLFAGSNNVPSNLTKGTGTGLSAIIFGDFSSLLICQWGGIELFLDPYTQKTNELIRTYVTAYLDIQVRHAESFSAMQDAVTS